MPLGTYLSLGSVAADERPAAHPYLHLRLRVPPYACATRPARAAHPMPWRLDPTGDTSTRIRTARRPSPASRAHTLLFHRARHEDEVVGVGVGSRRLFCIAGGGVWGRAVDAEWEGVVGAARVEGPAQGGRVGTEGMRRNTRRWATRGRGGAGRRCREEK